jgi:hypothetical protein
MSETPQKEPQPDTQAQDEPQPRGAVAGRLFFLLSTGVLLATLVSCACGGPAR